MGIRVQIYVRPDVNYDCHWSIFMYANPRLLNRKYLYTEFHENQTDSLDTGCRSQTDGLGKLFTNPLGRATLWCEEFRKCISVQVRTMHVAPVVAFFGSYTA